jgi:hypothetical protein
LFVGQKPETVDFSDPALPAGFDAEKIDAGIAVAVASIGERGWQRDTCMITPDEAGRAMLEKTPKGAAYDCVVIGGGLRIPPRGEARKTQSPLGGLSGCTISRNAGSASQAAAWADSAG